MNRLLRPSLDRTLLLLFIAHILTLVWLGPDLRLSTTAARSGDAPGWAVVLLLAGLSLMAYAVLEVYLLNRDGDPPPGQF